MVDVPEAGNGPCQCEPCSARARRRTVRAWRWTSSLDLTKPPAPPLRWVLLLILGLCCWATGIPLRIRDWLGPIIIAGALILPDVAGFGIAGMRLDLKQAQDELAELRQEVNAQARATAKASVGPIIFGREAGSGLEAYGEMTGAERDQQESYVPRHMDTSTLPQVPSEP